MVLFRHSGARQRREPGIHTHYHLKLVFRASSAQSVIMNSGRPLCGFRNDAIPYITGHHASRTKSPAKTAKAATRGRTAEERRSRLSRRRLGLHFPRLSRAAADQPQVRRAAAQCRVRLLQHAVEAFARHEAGGQADPSRGGVRPVREDASAPKCIPNTRRIGRTRPTICGRNSG